MRTPLIRTVIAATVLLSTGCGHVSAVSPVLTTAPSIGTRSASSAGRTYSPNVSVSQGSQLTSSTSQSGYGGLTGRVVALTNAGSQPLAGATVVINETGQRLVTDQTGSYAANNLPAGNYTLTAMTGGYQQASPNGALVSGGQMASVPDITMVPGNGPSGVSSISYVGAGAFGQGGEAPDFLMAPLGLAVRGSDALVLDKDSAALVHTGVIREYNVDTDSFQAKFGDYSKWFGLSQMKDTVSAICLDKQGRPLVLDGGGTIWRFTTGNVKDTTFSSNVSGGTGIACDGQGNILVASSAGLTKLAPDGSNPQALGQGGSFSAVACAQDGYWVIAGADVQKLGLDGSQVLSVGPSGTGNGAASQFTNPTALAVDPTNGDLLVADKGTKNVYVFDSFGTLIGKVGDGSFDTPTAVTVDASGKVYVLDNSKKLVYRFNPAGVR